MQTEINSRIQPCKEWSGFAEIWTADGWNLGAWPRAKLRITQGEIEAQVPRKIATFKPSEVIEARMFRFPLPSLTVIFKKDGEYSLVSFSCLSQAKLEAEMNRSGFEITSHRTWRTGFEAGKDEVKYHLHGSRRRAD